MTHQCLHIIAKWHTKKNKGKKGGVGHLIINQKVHIIFTLS